jgi:hypothetical protein
MEGMMKRWLYLLILVFLMMASVHAQTDTCPVEVATALNVASTSCQELGRNQVCYGHKKADVELHDSSVQFSEAGDIIPVDKLVSLRTYPLSDKTDDWGVALFRIQANLPDTLPGQNVTLVVFGEAEISQMPDAPADYSAPMQAFQIQTGIGDEACRHVPVGGVLVQTPRDQKVNLLVNGFELQVGSTAVLSSVVPTGLTVTTLDGDVGVTNQGVKRDVPAGFSLNVKPSAGIAPLEAPIPAPEVQVLLDSLLPDAVPQVGEPQGEITGLLNCASRGGVDAAAGSTLNLRGGWADNTLASVIRFAATTPPTLEYDGTSIPYTYRTGPSSTTAPGGGNFQMNWFWVVADVTAGTHHAVWHVGGETVDCEIRVS